MSSPIKPDVLMAMASCQADKHTSMRCRGASQGDASELTEIGRGRCRAQVMPEEGAGACKLLLGGVGCKEGNQDGSQS